MPEQYAKIIKQIFNCLYLQAVQQPAALLSNWNLLKRQLPLQGVDGWGQDNDDRWWGLSIRSWLGVWGDQSEVWPWDKNVSHATAQAVQKETQGNDPVIMWHMTACMCVRLSVWVCVSERQTGIWIWLAEFPTLVTLRCFYCNIFIYFIKSFSWEALALCVLLLLSLKPCYV